MTDIALLLVGMAAINLAIRLPVFVLADRIRFPRIVERALAYVPVSVLTAIIVPTVLAPPGPVDGLDWRNPFLLPAILTALLSLAGRGLLATIALGMAAYLGWRWILLG